MASESTTTTMTTNRLRGTGGEHSKVHKAHWKLEQIKQVTLENGEESWRAGWRRPAREKSILNFRRLRNNRDRACSIVASRGPAISSPQGRPRLRPGPSGQLAGSSAYCSRLCVCVCVCSFCVSFSLHSFSMINLKGELATGCCQTSPAQTHTPAPYRLSTLHEKVRCDASPARVRMVVSLSPPVFAV